VQGLLSLQFGATPPTQDPPAQVSAVVQALPSSHDAVLFVFTQPVAGTQESSVQGLLSLQLGADPPTQDPPAQVSAVVHALPSSHDAVLFVFTQPVAGTHESSVHGLLSLQFGAEPPTHTPAAHVSDVVQALPSSQDAALLALTQPVAGTQESSVHGLLSLQFGAEPPTHDPAEQVSDVVHALPSSQDAVLFV
jgi:hypothetical protein